MLPKMLLSLSADVMHSSLEIFSNFLFCFKQITHWLGSIVKDGDGRDLPFFVSLFNF